MQFSFEQVPTELDPEVAGSVNKTDAQDAVFLSARVPVPLLTLLIPGITRLICSDSLPPLSHKQRSLYEKKKGLFSRPPPSGPGIVGISICRKKNDPCVM